jgi:hypothetical protein
MAPAFLKQTVTDQYVALAAAGGGNAPGASTPTTPSTGVPASAGTGGGSKATPTAPYLTSGTSIQGAVSLALAFAAVAVYAVSAV